MTSDHTGAQIKMWRLRRGLSQAVLAGLVGVTQGYVSQVENALTAIDKRSTLAAFASALQVSVGELCEGDVPVSRPRTRAEAAVPMLRVALVEIAAGERCPSTLTADQIRTKASDLKTLRDRSDYARIVPLLPELLRDASAHGGVILAAVAYLCSSALRELRHRDLAWIASSVSVSAAADADDPTWVAAAASARLHAMPVESGLASEFARRAINTAEPFMATESVRRVCGMLHLQATLSSTVTGDTSAASENMAEAVRLAEEIGEPDLLDHFTPHMHFGPTNVNLWRMAAALEAGEPGRVLELASTTQPDRLESKTRTAMYWIDHARALSGVRRDDQAVAALVRAETAAPQLFRLRREAQDTVVALVGRARRNTASAPLKRLARTFGT